MFTVASARSIISAGDILKDVNWNLNGIFMNGVLLCDIISRKTVDFCTIKESDVIEMISIFNKHNRPPSVFTFNGNLSNGKYDTSISVRAGGIKHNADKEFFEARKNKYNEFLITEDYITQNAIYVNGLDDYNTMKCICDEVKKLDSVACELYEDIYSKKWLLECHSKNGTKAIKAKQLKDKYKTDKLVAFGDNFNDIELLKTADVAVVVDNAPDEVKKYADIIIDSNTNDGVARYLNSL